MGMSSFTKTEASKNLALTYEEARVNKQMDKLLLTPLYQHALAFFMEKTFCIRKQEWHFMGQHSLHTAKQVSSPCSAHSVFPTGCDVLR